jgi:hypothetical protein
MTEMEQEKRASLHADVMLRRALDLKADNVLIAEFMGHKLGLDGDGMGEPQCRIFEKGLGTKRIEDTYSKSWDWLMPVVIKVGARGNLLSAMKNLRPYGVLRTIEDTHQAVVEFINEYNKNN